MPEENRTALTISQPIWIAAPPERVYRALTELEDLNHWLYPVWEDGPIFPLLVPNKTVHLDWAHGEPADDVGDTAVFELTPENNGTLLHFQHAGFNSAPESLPMYTAHLQAWLGALFALKCYLEYNRDLSTAWTKGKGNWGG